MLLSYLKILGFFTLLVLFWGCSSKQSVPDYNYQVAKGTMKPYVVHGKKYYPQSVNVGDEEIGIASWYGPNFHGKHTSNGEIYDMNALSAAHKTYPMNTMVKVTNLDNGKNLAVRINDRGPFVKGRVIDLSKMAADKLGVISSGTAKVKIQVIGFANKNQTTIVGGNFMVQIGAFRNKNGANIYKNSVKFENYTTVIKEYFIQEAPLFRVFITGFRSKEEAQDFINMGKISGSFIVRE